MYAVVLVSGCHDTCYSSALKNAHPQSRIARLQIPIIDNVGPRVASRNCEGLGLISRESMSHSFHIWKVEAAAVVQQKKKLIKPRSNVLHPVNILRASRNQILSDKGCAQTPYQDFPAPPARLSVPAASPNLSVILCDASTSNFELATAILNHTPAQR